MAGLDGLTTGAPLTSTDYSGLVNQAYGSIGRTGFGAGVNQIDQPGFDYWTNQLQSGAINPQQFQSAFLNAAANYSGPNASAYQPSINAAKNQLSLPAQQINAQLPTYTGSFADEQAQTAANQAAGIQTVGGLPTAQPDINTQIAQNYQNLFGRAADTEGTQYWAGTGLTGQALIDAMSAGARGGDIGALYHTNDIDISRDITASDIRNYVGQNINDPYAIFSAAEQNKVDPQTIAAVMGWSPQDTSGFINKYNVAKQVQQEYQDIGRGLTGDTAIDREGFNYWYNQLQSGAITPADFEKTFVNAAYQTVNQPNSQLPTNVSDKTYQEYFRLHPEAVTNYTADTTQNIFGSNYTAPTGYNEFQTSLNDKLQSGEITRSQYESQLQNSTYNKAQEANRIANIGKSLYGMTDEEAVQLAKDVYQGKSTSSELGSHYQDFLKDPNKATADILKERANASDATTNPYFQQNPDLLSVYRNVGQTVQTTNAGAGGQYGYYQGKPILKASEVDDLFNQMGTDYIRGNAADKRDNDIGWDSGSLGGVTARGAAAFGIQKQGGEKDPDTGAETPVSYTGDMNAIATKLGLNPSNYSSQDALYNAINDKTKDFVFIAGKSGKDAGGIGTQGQTAAFQNATGNHAAQMFKKQGDKYIPVGDTTFYNGDMELHHGGLGALAPILSMAAMAFAPELAAFYGGGAMGAAGAGATLGAGSAALGNGNIIKGGIIGGLGGYLGSQVGAIGNEIGSALNISDPAIQNILARGSINLGLNIAGGAPLENALLNTGVNTGLNLGMNAAGIPNTPATNFATSVAAPLITTGKVNPMTVANSALRTIQQSQPKKVKQGGLINMKTGGKVQHFEDGGDVGYDWGGWGDIGGASYPTIDYGNLDLSGVNYDFPSFFDTSFGGNNIDFGTTTFTDTNPFVTDFNFDNTAELAPVIVTAPREDSFNPFAETVSYEPTDGGLSVIPSDVTSANSGFSSIDNRSPTILDIGPGVSNTDAFDFTSGQAYNNQVTGIDELIYEAANPGVDVQIMDDGSKLFVDQDSGRPLGGVDEDGRSFHVDENGRGVYDDTGESVAGTPSINFGGNLANLSDVNRLLNYNAGYYNPNLPITGLPTGPTGPTGPTLPPPRPTGPTLPPPRPTGPTGPVQPRVTTAQQQAKQAATQGGLTNLVGSVTKANPNFTLSGMPSALASIPMYKAAGGRINLPQFQALNNYIDHNFDSNYAPQMAKGGQASGLDHVPEFYSEGGLGNRYVKGRGNGTSDEVPAMLANGEFVIPADVVSGLGNGSNDSGAKILDEFLKVIRRDKRAASPDKLPADSKGPQAYLLQAKRKVRK